MTEHKAFDIAQFKPLFKEERKNLVSMAKLAENAERYEDMCKIMRALVEHTASLTATADKSDLSVEERNLLSVAFKNVVGARRASWRTFNADEHKDDPIAKLYKKQVETELEAVCKDVLDLLMNILLKNHTEENESRVFYLKMTADYYRYLAEFHGASENVNPGYDKKAAEYYKSAMDIATQKLQPTNPIRLGLALNYSVCLYEILKEAKNACDLAKTAFDQAIAKLDKVDEASYKDSTLIMKLIRDNLTLWTSSQENPTEEAENADQQ